MKYPGWMIMLLLILSSNTKPGFCQSQDYPQASNHRQLEQYVSEIEPVNDLLYRGKVFIPSAHPRDNHPFLHENRWSEGEVSLDGEIFTGVLMKLDIVSDELRFSLPLASRSVFVLPHPARIENFRIQGHHLIRIMAGEKYNEVPDEGFYEVLFERGVMLLVKHRKFLRHNASGLDQYEKSERRYIVNNAKFYLVRGKRDVLRAFGDQEQVVKQYLRDNKIYIKGSGQEGLIDIVRYYSTLDKNSNE